jgi:hypothetical protein
MMRALFLAVALACCMLPAATVAQQKPQVPAFHVDPTWPKQLPHNWILGQVNGMFVDKDDHIWVFQRAGALKPDELGLVLKPQRYDCCAPAPPILVFDQQGNVIKSWGGKGHGYPWFDSEHGIFIDGHGYVWLTGNGPGDGMVLKMTQDGKFVMKIGREGPPTGNLDPTIMGRPASVWVDDAANEVYVADGYVNRRVIVYDSNTGKFKRLWGAYGKKPSDLPQPPYVPNGPHPKQFGNPVHCVRIAEDGLVYVCDRSNDRYQVFHKDGTFVREVFIAPKTLYSVPGRDAGSVWDLQFWKTPGQPYFIEADGANDKLRVIDRKTGSILSEFGHQGRQVGEFHWLHSLAIDSRGNLYTGEVDTGNRIQRFLADEPLSGK